MSEETFEKIKETVSSVLGVEKSEITESSHLLEDLNADPLSIADLIVALEKEFDIQIPQVSVSSFTTVGDILNYISDQVGD